MLVLGNTQMVEVSPIKPGLLLPGLLAQLGPFFTPPTRTPKLVPDFKHAEASDFPSSHSGPS